MKMCMELSISVLRLFALYLVLKQVNISCGADDTVHIQLNLDGKDDKTLPKLNIAGLVKMWYDDKGLANPKYSNNNQEALVAKAGLKKLYIRGTFEIEKVSNVQRFLWDNKSKGAKDLAKFILHIFKNDAVVIVVFPDDLQTYTGFQFQKEFEEEVQKTNDKISVGRGVINVYLGLGDQNQVEKEIEKQKNMVSRVFDKNEKYYSIFANYYENRFSFRTVFTEWRSEINPVNIFQVKIQEADSVTVKLVSVCCSKLNALNVGSNTEKKLADILLKLLRVEIVKTHPKQRVRVELPEVCGTAKQREAFTDQLINNLQQQKLTVYGKEPRVHLHVHEIGTEFQGPIKLIKEAHLQDLVGEIKNGKIISQVSDQERKLVSSAKELFIHIHCHGRFNGNRGTICGRDSTALAKMLLAFIKMFLDKSVTKVGFIQFHVCNAGSPDGLKFVGSFLTEFDNLLKPHNINIQESLSYSSSTAQFGEHTQVTVPCGVKSESKNNGPNVHEKHVYGRFTVRTIKTPQSYKPFSVLPLTEYSLVYSE
ncbi:uncharacterized protein [Hoplias malabaricus]|uniref:uncharacterized protein n=1 Tax=Hoplias malabaricus TaxID=27720 RepID=UPI003461F955